MITITKEEKDKQIVLKTWGSELILHNRADYCAKLLCFNRKGAKASMHFHMVKNETWYIREGIFLLKYIDTDTATKHEVTLEKGHIIEIEKGSPHQLECLTPYGEIFEASTMHYDYDSYRIEKGDGQ